MIQNKVVIQAFRDLSTYVNKSMGIVHPLDRAAAIETFIILRDAGEDFTSKDVRAFLIDDGWVTDYAQEVADIAQKVLDGKKFSIRVYDHYRPDILEIWRKAADRSQ